MRTTIVETVCHVITKLELGGAQEVALHAVSHLDRQRYHPVLVTGAGGLLTEEAQRLDGVDVVVLRSLVRPIHPLADGAALVQLTRLFLRLRPGIVHTHSSKAGLLGRWAAWLARVPVIVHTIHGYGITPAQPRWLQRLLVGLERITALCTTQWIAVAHADVDRGRRWGLFDNNIVVIRPGIDPGPFAQPLPADERAHLRSEFGAGPDDFLVGTIACLKPQKAPEDFVAVAKRVSREEPRAKFVLIGDGELRPRIERLLQSEGLSGRVHLAGWRRDIPSAMQAFDVFLLTSHWEGLPRVLLEARAAGIPVVATQVGGAAEAVVPGRHGTLCASGDVSALSREVMRVIQGFVDGRRIRNLDPLPREFDIAEMVKAYQTLYDMLLPRARSGQAAWSPLSL